MNKKSFKTLLGSFIHKRKPSLKPKLKHYKLTQAQNPYNSVAANNAEQMRRQQISSQEQARLQQQYREAQPQIESFNQARAQEEARKQLAAQQVAQAKAEAAQRYNDRFMQNLPQILQNRRSMYYGSPPASGISSLPTGMQSSTLVSQPPSFGYQPQQPSFGYQPQQPSFGYQPQQPSFGYQPQPPGGYGSQPFGRSNMTQGIGSLPFGSNMPRYGR